MRAVLREADRIWSQHNQELVVTSGLDGTHGPTSWHYFGCAIDFRTRYFDDDERDDVYDELVEALPAYDIIKHDTHIHVEIGNQLADTLRILF